MIAHVFEEAFGVSDDSLFSLSYDAKRVSERGGAVILQAYDAARNHAQVSVRIGERVQDAQSIVSSGNVVLYEQFPVVGRRAYIAPYARHFLGRVHLVSFALVRHVGVLELRGVGGFRDERVGELVYGQRFGAVFAAVEIPGFRIGDVELLAQVVESMLLGDAGEHVVVVAGSHDPCFF